MNCEYDGIGFITNIGKSKYWGVAQDPSGNSNWTVQLRSHIGKTSTFRFQGVNPKEEEVAQIAANIKHLDSKVLPKGDTEIVTKAGIKYVVNFDSKIIMYHGLDKIGSPTTPVATTTIKQSVNKMVKKVEFDGIGIVTNVGSSKYWGVSRNETTSCGWIVNSGHKSHSIDNPFATEQDAAQIANALYEFKGMDKSKIPNEYITVECQSGNTYSVNPHVSKITMQSTSSNSNVVPFTKSNGSYTSLPAEAIDWSQDDIKLLQKLTEMKINNMAPSFWNTVQRIVNM